MKTDLEIQEDVLAQLRWEPILNAAEIGVTVKNGIVTLTGQVDSFLKKRAAEKAVKKIGGVTAVAQDIQVGISPTNKKTDTEIAQEVLRAFKWHTAVPDDRIEVQVEDGFVTLKGDVDWAYQRESAVSSIENLAGVRLVVNEIIVKVKPVAENVKQKIKAAFVRYASLDANEISVDVTGNKVTLTGNVNSFSEKEEAENAAWLAPGVSDVDNRIKITEENLIFN